MKYDFVVIGANGLQGRIVSRDLLEKEYKVFLCDKSKEGAEKLIEKYDETCEFKYLDLNDKTKTAHLLKEANAPVVVNCAEGDFNLSVQKICLRLGFNYLDLGSEPEITEKQFELHEAFERKKLCAITGCGSAPGIVNVMLRDIANKLSTISSVEAGFAWTANIPSFVVPFSIISIIEEFTEPATVVRNGEFKKIRARSNLQKRKFKSIGWQNIFLVNHAEPYTFYEFLKDKGIKDVDFYAGFPKFSYDIIMAFIKAGLGSKKKMESGLRPVDLLREALTMNKPPREYKEKENIWIEVQGEKNGRARTMYMNCIVPTLKGWEKHGCNIDTGLPCSIMAQMIKEGVITATGSKSPEFFVPVKPFFKELEKRKMKIIDFQ